MAVKKDAGTKTETKAAATPAKDTAKTKKAASQKDDDDDAEDEEEELKPKRAAKGKTKSANDNDDDDDGPEPEDEWEKTEDENWDPDFDEFDIPASKTKKAGGKKSTGEISRHVKSCNKARREKIAQQCFFRSVQSRRADNAEPAGFLALPKRQQALSGQHLLPKARCRKTSGFFIGPHNSFPHKLLYI